MVSEIDEPATVTLDPPAEPWLSPVAGAQGGASAPLGTIDRYLVAERVGAGGVGAVYRARDPMLGRDVAIKVLLPARSAADASTASARLVAEAQAIAQLTHPNVIPVYDVGRFQPQTADTGLARGQAVFMVMELVEGAAVSQWLQTERRPWRDVLAVFVDAGRGLAAAHAQGIVHRDFKPSNVLIGDDGRVRVLDFGLARGLGQTRDPASARPKTWTDPSLSGSGALSGPDTATGIVMGTPSYMSPEQHEAGDVDARSDQYSFCVSLYEGLYGRRPFANKTLRELFDAKLRGVDESSPDAEIPATIHQAVVRGLQVEPADRWPSMDALLSVLSATSTPRARRWWIPLGLVSIAAVGALVVANRAPSGDLCQGAPELIAAAFDQDRATAITRAFEVTQIPHAAQASETVNRGLAAFADVWSAEHADACEATHVRSEQTEEVLDLRLACLDRQRAEIAAMVEAFTQADASTVDRAVAAVGRLESPSACADPAHYRDEIPLPADTRVAADVTRARARLAEARGLTGAGAYARAATVATEAAETAERVDYAPLIAEAQFELGGIISAQGQYDRASEHYETAYFAAVSAGHDLIAGESAVALVNEFSRTLGQLEEAEKWSRPAQQIVTRLADPSLEARLHNALGLMHGLAGRHEPAMQEHRKSLALREQLSGPDDLSVAVSANALGMTYARLERPEAARKQFERALAIWETHLGPSHPAVAHGVTNVAIALVSLDRLDDAIERFDRALSLRTDALGADHPDVGKGHSNLGAVMARAGRHEQALEHFESAAEILERALGSDDATVGQVTIARAEELHALGRRPQAIAAFEQGVRVLEAAYGRDHVESGRARVRLAELRAATGEHAGG